MYESCLGLSIFCLSKALHGFFPLYFQLLYLPEETCFQQAGLLLYYLPSGALRCVFSVWFFMLFLMIAGPGLFCNYQEIPKHSTCFGACCCSYFGKWQNVLQNTFTTNKVPKHSTCFPTCFCVFWFCSDVGECQNLWQNLWHKSAKTHFQSKRNYSQAKKTLK